MIGGHDGQLVDSSLSANPNRTGVAATLVIVIIVVVLVIASVGAYYVLSSSKVTSTTTSVASTPGGSTSTTTHTSVSLRSSTASGVSTTSANLTYYSGTFNYSLPLLGPSGVRSFTNGTVQVLQLEPGRERQLQFLHQPSQLFW